MDLNRLSSTRSCGSFQYMARFPSAPYLKPITIITFSHFHRRSRRSLTQVSSYGVIPWYRQKGIVFEWPRKEKFYSEKDLCFAVWILAHIMFWLQVIHIFPNGTALDLSQPPWRYKIPVPKPENRDYIIEPDWDSSGY